MAAKKVSGMNIRASISLYAALYSPTATSLFINESMTMSILKAIIEKIAAKKKGRAFFIRDFQKFKSTFNLGKITFLAQIIKLYPRTIMLTKR